MLTDEAAAPKRAAPRPELLWPAHVMPRAGRRRLLAEAIGPACAALEQPVRPGACRPASASWPAGWLSLPGISVPCPTSAGVPPPPFARLLALHSRPPRR